MTFSMGRTVLLAVALSLSLHLPAAAADLAGSEWRPTHIGDSAVPDDAGLFLRFEGEGQLKGHSGCNAFFGSYQLEGDRIEIGPLGATRMACEGAVMDRETTFLDGLAAAATFERDGARLTLGDESGAALVLFVQTDWD